MFTYKLTMTNLCRVFPRNLNCKIVFVLNKTQKTYELIMIQIYQKTHALRDRSEKNVGSILKLGNSEAIW